MHVHQPAYEGKIEHDSAWGIRLGGQGTGSFNVEVDYTTTGENRFGLGVRHGDIDHAKVSNVFCGRTHCCNASPCAAKPQ
jgi:hypothetical protein